MCDYLTVYEEKHKTSMHAGVPYYRPIPLSTASVVNLSSTTSVDERCKECGFSGVIFRIGIVSRIEQ
jgi:hypothetical protein